MRKSILALFLLGSAQAQEPSSLEVSATTGADYLNGDYNTGDTAHYFALSENIQLLIHEQLNLYLAIPFFLTQTSKSVTNVGGQITRNNRRRGAFATSETVTGFGDIRSGLAGMALKDQGPSEVWLGGDIKFPTASGALGTGEFDFGILSAINHFTSVLDLFLFGKYTFTGDSTGEKYKDFFSYSLGLGKTLGEKNYLALSIDGATTIVNELDPPVSLIGSLSVNIHPSWWLQPHASVGFTNGSEDFGLGLSFRYTNEINRPGAPDLT